jgi:hypothetical protein
LLVGTSARGGIVAVHCVLRVGCPVSLVGCFQGVQASLGLCDSSKATAMSNVTATLGKRLFCNVNGLSTACLAVTAAELLTIKSGRLDCVCVCVPLCCVQTAVLMEFCC